MNEPMFSVAQKSALRSAGCCDCERACMLTSADCRHKRLRCRYRHGSVQPLNKAAAALVNEIADRESAGIGGQREHS